MQAIPPRRPISDFRAVWQTLGIEGATLHQPLGATRVPPLPLPSTDPRRAVERLPQLGVAAPTADQPAHADLQVGGELGRGGMGLVREATQVSLRRSVAVKTLHADKHTPDAVQELLREARLTGALEHPNIVPVYALGRSEDGVPMLVMKRVEGTSWRELLDNPQHPSLPRDPGLALEHHLGILTQVCNAVHFAHAKGIVHRDLKPENVMLGSYGEVYLLDWGVALELDAAGEEQAGVCGTPVWMAPEMVSGVAAHIDARTDVYLLGGLLHAILTGQPRHAGEDLFAVLFSAWTSAPIAYDDRVPPELAALCNCAMHHDPEQRPQTAEEFRKELGEFMRHRNSAQLEAEATTRLASLRQLVQRQSGLVRDDADVAAELAIGIYNLFGECRFGFQQALRTWPENERAAAGLQGALECMARYELAQGEYHAASVLFAELHEPPEDLRTGLQALGQRLAQDSTELERLKDLQREHDPEIGKQIRAEFSISFGVVWALLPAAFGLLEQLGLFTVTYFGYLLSAVFFGLFVAAGTWLGRATLLQNRVNRAFVRSLGVAAVGLLVHRVMVWMTGGEIHKAMADDMLLFFMVMAGMAATIDRRLAWSAAVYLCGALLAARVGSGIYILMAVCNLVACTAAALVWKPRSNCELDRLRVMRHLHEVRARALAVATAVR